MARALSLSKRCKLTALLITTAMVIVLLPSLASGQGSTPDRGFQPSGSYALSDIETVNTNNGNLMLNIALGKLAPGRGGLSGQLSLRYDSKLYDSHTQWYQDWDHMIGDQPVTVVRNMLVTSDQGGWHYGTSYEMQLIDRMNQYPPEIAPQYPDMQTIRHYKLKVAFPDGSVHEFLPRGFGSNMEEGWYDVRPDGFQTQFQGGIVQDVPCLTSTLTYYTFDGTYLRLEVQHDSDANWWNNPWTLYFPDGTKVTNGNRITDRNGNYVEWSNITYNGHPATQLMDQLGRKIIIEYQGISNGEIIHVPGVGGVDLTYQVHWKSIQVFKTYSTYDLYQHNHDPDGYPDLLGDQFVVSAIDLPAASGGLQYVFGYNAVDYGSTPCCTPSYGWGELSSVTLPSGAHAEYKYSLDGQDGPGMLTMWNNVLLNGMYRKTLTYQQQYDGNSTLATEVWNYGGGMITPAGGHIVQIGQPTFYTETADGSVNEKLWQANQPQGFPVTYLYDPIQGINVYDPQRANLYVKTEFTSIRDGNGTLVKTAIKDYTVDKNGNVTSTKEYDWVDYGSVPRDANNAPTGVPASAVLKRVTTNNYVAATPDASDSSSNDADSYWNSTSPSLKSVVASTEGSNGSTTLTRSEFFYDNPATTGNLTQQKSWDSTKGAYSNPLAAGNSISTSTQYNQYGSPILITDARGVHTQIVYGSVGGFTDLYPTQVKTAYQTAVQRTETREYDFSTGAVTRVTDLDNNVATATTYDVFGRPTLVKVAEGKTEETRTATEYSDVNRRVIVRSDLNTLGDGKLVSIQHYDQLGRIRLARQLEDSATQSATDETTGIKVQTRYVVSNPCQPESTGACLADNSSVLGSYQLVSNPYRASTSSAAGSETTMGWTRSRSDKAGRNIEVQTFGGASLPSPWQSNTVSTGTITTTFDANSTTVTDQVQKQTRTVKNAFGQLVRIDEPDSNGNLGSITTPTQPTYYTYDVFGNLTQVTQSEGTTTQNRYFTYSSLSRLTLATNPESGTINYKYDDGGNLVVKTDARTDPNDQNKKVSAHYEYDALNRTTRRWFNGSSSVTSVTHNSPGLPAGVGNTDEVRYFYDSQSLPQGAPNYVRGYSLGRMVALTYGTGSNGDYFAYDAGGRPTLKYQQTDSVNYRMTLTYNVSGAITNLSYPSDHTVTNSIDTAGRLSAFSGNLGEGGAPRTYSTGLLYSADGGLHKEQFATTTPIYNKQFYNSRTQLAEIRIGTSYTGPTDYSADRGAFVNNYSTQCSGICAGSSMTDNNGTLRKQEIYIPNEQTRSQEFAYDSLDRLDWVREVLNGVEQWKQKFTYDRWGNRTINTNVTYGTGINNKAFTVNPANNRLGVPANQSGQMTYDAAGNLTNDTYTGGGNRTFDAENRITSALGGNSQAQLYSYDGSGQRIRRTVNGTETWMVYGFNGELLAEYAATSSPGTPQKEYGYRNGKLLIVATPGTGDQSLNLNGTSSYVQVPNSSSLNINGAITVEAWIKVNAITGAYQDIITRESWGQSGTGGGYELCLTNTGKLRLDTYQSPTAYTTLVGNTTVTTGVWHHVAGVFDGGQMRLYVDGVLDASLSTTNAPASGTSSVKIGRTSGGSYFGGLIDEARVSNSAVYTSNFTPQTHLTASGSTKGLWKFDGSSTADSSGNGNNGTLQSATFSADVPAGPSTSYYSGSFNGIGAYVQVPNSTSVNISGAITVEAWIKVNAITGAYQDIITRESWGQSGTGGGYELCLTNTGKLRLDTYQSPTAYTTLVGNTTVTTGVWHHVAGVFDGTQMRLYIDGVLDASLSTTNAPASGTSSLKLGRTSGGSYFGGLIDEARVSNSAVYTSNFTPQTHLAASGSTKGLWKFDSQSTNDSSGNGNNGSLQGGATYSADVPSGDGGGAATSSGTSAQVQWLVSDHLGTQRMIIDQTGSLANVKRHDYLPFGEELFGGTNSNPGPGGRKPSQGYGCEPSDSTCTPDQLRQQFTSIERDVETGLDYFGARYYASVHGRFVSPDPLHSSGRAIYPQSWNRYSYVINKPLSLVDPNGMDWGVAEWFDGEQWIIDYHYFTGKIGEHNGHRYEPVDFGEDATRTLDLSDGRRVTIANDPDVLGGRFMLDVTPVPQVAADPVLPPSPVDNMLVIGSARQFMFDVETHQFEHAIVSYHQTALEAYAVISPFRHLLQGAKRLYHYTDELTAAKIEETNRIGKPDATEVFLTDNGNLSPVQAKIELGLAPNKNYTALFSIETQSLQGLIRIGRVVGNVNKSGGGGIEFVFDRPQTGNIKRER